LDVLQAMGFGVRWRRWIATLLSTASSSILMNGQPGKRIRHQRGVRQGDSLSPPAVHLRHGSTWPPICSS
jgi:hypothetical protein